MAGRLYLTRLGSMRATPKVKFRCRLVLRIPLSIGAPQNEIK